MKGDQMPSFRVTYHIVVEAESPDEAIAEAAKAAGSGGLSEPGGRTELTVERIPDPEAPSGFVAEGVRRKHRKTES
jgi:hypothetical protein